MNYLNKNLTIGTDPVIILIDRQGLNSKRICYSLNNNSPAGQIITIAVGEPAVANSGQILNVGGNISKSILEKPEQVMFTAVSSVAGGTLAIYEESE